MTARASSAFPRTFGDYVYSYSGHKSAVNLGAIGTTYRPVFANANQPGLQHLAVHVHVCGFGAIGGVTASTSGFTTAVATNDYGATWVNNGFDIVDAGPLTAGACAGAVGRTARLSGLVRNIRLSTAYSYCDGRCVGDDDIQSIVAHEAGHLYGFEHAVDDSQVRRDGLRLLTDLGRGLIRDRGLRSSRQRAIQFQRSPALMRAATSAALSGPSPSMS